MVRAVEGAFQNLGNSCSCMIINMNYLKNFVELIIPYLCIAKQVFMAERKMAAGGAWHKACFNCRECHKRLDSHSIRERDQDIYCNRKFSIVLTLYM